MPLAASLKAPPIVGTGIQKGREGQITVIAFTHGVTSPINAATGSVGAGRSHTPFVVTKHIDMATPALHQAHTNGTVFPEWTLRLFHLPRSGSEVHYFSIVLKDVRVAAIRSVMPNLTTQAFTNVHEYEEVALAYRAIEWRSEVTDDSKSSVTGSDGEPEFAPDDWAEAHAEAAMMKLIGELEAQGKKYAGKKIDAFKSLFVEKAKSGVRAEVDDTGLVKLYAPPQPPKTDGEGGGR